MINIPQMIHKLFRPNKILRRFVRLPPQESLDDPDVEESDFDHEYCDDDDPDRLESDLMSVGKVYDKHKQELMIDKEKLKMRIVARKYFKSEDPNFITWSERTQIKALHNADNVEWTVERLSEAFPALPETITKILKSKYAPKTAEAVVKYDNNVIANWAKFKRGSIALNPRLEAHLNNFKGRKIEVTDLMTAAEKFVKPKPVFPAPKSNIFTNIVKGHIEQKADANAERKKLHDRTIPKNKESKELARINPSDKANPNQKHVTFDAFLEDRVNKVAGNVNISLEDQLLVNEYKERHSARALQNSETTTEATVVNQEAEQSSSVALSNRTPVTTIKVPKIDLAQDSLATGILEWKKKESDVEDNYPNYIKIPRNKAKSGVTFKVKDRYYDADGEFLYRVPGLTS